MQIAENSRVWIYQSDRRFSDAEVASIQELLNTFTGQWLAHGQQLAAKAEVRYNRFIILMVDEAYAGATGCSIDKSVNLMKEIEKQYQVNLFDRFNIAYRQGEEILTCSRETYEKLIAEGKVTENTMVFNNLVQNVSELNTNWEIPFKKSWHAKVFGSSMQNTN